MVLCFVEGRVDNAAHTPTYLKAPKPGKCLDLWWWWWWFESGIQGVAPNLNYYKPELVTLLHSLPNPKSVNLQLILWVWNLFTFPSQTLNSFRICYFPVEAKVCYGFLNFNFNVV